MRGLSQINRVLGWVRRQFREVAVILMYHRIVDAPLDPRGTAVSPDNFARHLEHIQYTCHPMRLLDLTAALQTRSLPRRAVAITFDDGYANNFTRAYPLLVSRGIPATVFVTTGYIDSTREFWWDQLDQILLLHTDLPECLQLRVQGQEYEWPTRSEQQRQVAHAGLRYHMRTLPTQEREGLLADLMKWAGSEQNGRLDSRPMTTAELMQLKEAGLFELGAHTVTHPVLSTLSPDVQYAEIAESRCKLEAIIGSPIRTFAYPYGESEHFTDETVQIVKGAGFDAACTAIHGIVEYRDDPFRLRRCAVRDWDVERFKRQLDSFFAA